MSDTFRVIEYLKSDFFRVKKSIMSRIPVSVSEHNSKSSEKITVALVKVVYVSMAEFAHNHTQKLFPSYNRLMSMTGLSRPSIRKAIDFLCCYGYIHKRSNGIGKNNTYYLTEPDLSREGSDCSQETPPPSGDTTVGGGSRVATADQKRYASKNIVQPPHPSVSPIDSSAETISAEDDFLPNKVKDKERAPDPTLSPLSGRGISDMLGEALSTPKDESLNEAKRRQLNLLKRRNDLMESR